MYLRKSLRFGDFYSSGNFNMATVWQISGTYEDLGDYKGLADFYEEVISFYPGAKPNPQLFASLSTVYAKLGNKNKARETTYRMLRIYPELKGEAGQFLTNLEKL